MINEFESSRGFNTLYSIFKPLIIPKDLGRVQKQPQYQIVQDFYLDMICLTISYLFNKVEGCSTLDTTEIAINYYDIDTEDHLNQK